MRNRPKLGQTGTGMRTWFFLPAKPNKPPGAILMMVLLAAACIAEPSTQENGVKIEDTRTALEKWVETKRITSKERRDAALAQEMLKERIELVSREIESLRGKISDAEESIAEADKKREDLLEQNERLKQASSSLEAVLAELESGVKKLLPRVPDPVRERLKPLSQRLPENSEETKLSLSERFQNVVGILNELNKTNREITVTSEVRTLPDGTSAEVTALYLGIAQGYYTGANNTLAGIGTSTEEGWVWTPANEIAGKVADAIAILKNERVASFVQLPIDDKEGDQQ